MQIYQLSNLEAVPDKLTKLVVTSLDGSDKLTDNELKTLSRLSSLRSLSLTIKNISDAGLVSLVKLLPSLEGLGLYGGGSIAR